MYIQYTYEYIHSENVKSVSIRIIQGINLEIYVRLEFTYTHTDKLSIHNVSDVCMYVYG